MIKTIVYIEGMSCGHCASRVQTTLEKLDSIESVQVDLEKNQAIITSLEKLDQNRIKAIIEDLGYSVVKIVEE